MSCWQLFYFFFYFFSALILIFIYFVVSITYLILMSALLALVKSLVALHGLFVSTFIPTLVRMRDEPFEMTLLHTVAGFCNPLGQSVFLQKPMTLNLTLCHCPELFNWVKLRGIRRKIHIFISSILNIPLYVFMRMNGCIIHNYIITFHMRMFIHFIESHFQETNVVARYST